MMKRFMTLLALLATLFFAGCGGGNGDANGDGPTPTSQITFNIANTQQSPGFASVTLNIDSNQSSDLIIELNNFFPQLEGFSFYNVTASPMSLTYNTSCRQQIVIGFNYSPSNITLPLGNLNILYTKNVKSIYSNSTYSVNEKFTLCCPTAIARALILNASPTDIEVEDSNTTTNIDVTLVDEYGQPKPDVSITALLNDTEYGTLDKYSAKTDQEGHVQFTYTAPDNTADLKGKDIPFDIKLSNTPSIKATVTLHF